MKTLNRFITEKLKLGKNVQIETHNFYPKNFDELRSLLKQLLDERGEDADLNDIDVSQVTSFGDQIKIGKYKDFWGLFYGLDPHNIDISQWNVSNVEDMKFMFYNCKNFIGKGLENWNVSKVEDMDSMFRECKKFTGKGLEKWNVSNVKDMRYMFFACQNFNYDLSNWNVSNVKNMHNMFGYCDSIKKYPIWYKQ